MKISVFISFLFLAGCATPLNPQTWTEEYWQVAYAEMYSAGEVEEISDWSVLEYELGINPYPPVACGVFYCGSVY